MVRNKTSTKNKLTKRWGRFVDELLNHKKVYILLALVILVGLFIRVYRTDQILGFYYDQGRDAMAVWNLWHNGDFFLIGPTTGIEGIFRGPFYFYLIAPLYLISGGNPVLPAVFLAFTTMLAVILIYYLGFKISDRKTGLIAATIASFSFNLMMDSRWLSNPTPMLFLSMMLVWMMILVTEGRKWAWPVIALVAGMSLFHFGSAGEVFYFIALFIFAIWQKKNWPNLKITVLTILAFIFTIAPQVLFDIRNDGILSKNIGKFLFGDGSFKLSFLEVVKLRINFYYEVFASKIFHSIRRWEVVFLGVTAGYFILKLPKLFKNDEVKILLLLLATPLVGLLFFQGNYGNIYDYYMTGYFLIFTLLVSVVLGNMLSSKAGWVFVTIFVAMFVYSNLASSFNRVSAGVDGPSAIALGNQKQAIDWIYGDAGGKDFNVDVYVPPVIPHAYDYLFKWLGTTKYNQEPVKEQINLLYTLYEVDPPHPERLDAWLARQAGIGEVQGEVVFGGITVQRRERL